MGKLLNWLKQNIYPVFTVFLLIFIPLYPKLPTLDIFGTWVYIRLEDFAVAIAILYLLVDTVRSKKIPKTSLTIPIIVYWIAGGISVIWSVLFIGPKLAGFFPHLELLHYARRFEYMFLFFIAYKSIKNSRNIRLYIGVLSCVTIAVILYGLGQKFLGFPAYLTMNEEFAKGIPLRLPPTARIPSTFGGHYDLGAFLVMVIPIFISLMVGLKKWGLKIFFMALSLSSLGLLLLTASRISFGVYLLAACAVYLWYKKPLLIIPTVIISFIMLNMVSTASERFYKTFRFSNVIVDLSTGKPIGTLDKLEGGKALLDQQESPAKENLPQGTEFINVPQSSQSLASVNSVELFKSADLATGSGEIATVSGSFLIQKALVYDISITTRFQGEWPKAIEAFKRNIILGSGYSTLSVATDGDYLRMLGETGLLGTLSFLGIFYAFYTLFRRQKKSDPIVKVFAIGVMGGLVGLLLNAVLIDVFEASKVAFSFWIILGLCVGLLDLNLNKENQIKYGKLVSGALFNQISYGIYLVIGVSLVYGRIMSGYFVGDDFTWLKWAATSSLSDIGSYFTQASGFFYRPIPKLWYFILYSVFWLKAGSYFFVTLLVYLGLVFLIYQILKMRGVRWYLAWLVAFLFGVLSIHHENLFWISGNSSLLAAGFMFWSLYLFLSGWQQKGKHIVRYVLATILCALSMLSYDGMIVAPLAIWLISVFAGRKKVYPYIWILLLIPAYWYIRSASGAVFGTGDYAYNQIKLPYNVTANTIGYLVSIFAGPKAIETFQQLRETYRNNLNTVGLYAGLTGLILGLLLLKFRKLFKSLSEGFYWLILSVIMLVPYLGLGGLAERYALAASGFAILSVGVIAEKIFKAGNLLGIKFVVICLFIAGIIWNINQVDLVASDWKKADSISRQTLLTVKKEFFPLRSSTAFAIVNIPIRYGRAWIFPTGLNDAFWHLFRGSDYKVFEDKTLSEAFAHTGYGALYVLTFENYTLKQVHMEVVPR